MNSIKITKQMAINRFRVFCKKHCDSSQGKDWCYGYWQSLVHLGLLDVCEDDYLLYEFSILGRCNNE